jgi:tetratricopeptide (TPR) repeat protein
MSDKMTACERAAEIGLAAAEDSPVPDEDADFLKRHLEECTDCRLERATDKLLAYDDDDLPVAELDDLSRRRLVDGIIDEHEAERAEAGAAKTSHTVTGGRVTFGIIAAAAVLLLCVVGVLLSQQAGDRRGAQPEPHPVAASDFTAELLLASGEITASGSVFQVRDQLPVGERLLVRDGEVAMGLPTGITVLGAAGTELVLGRLDDEAIRIDLERGDLLISATPGRSGPGFSIATGSGEVFVTGTVFSVVRTARAVDVSVYRGSVRIEEPGRKPRALAAGRTMALGAGEARPVDPPAEQAALLRARALDLLERGAGISVRVSSVPPGAAVMIDGSPIGATPVGAAVRPGHRKLEISLDGHAPVSERIEIGGEGAISRVFELKPIPVASAVETGSEPAEKARPVRPEPPVISARELLKIAQALRANRDWQGAVGAYSRLVESYPSSPEARSARVSMGSIQLDHLGRPQDAIRNFDAYLNQAPRGPLAPEAAYGRARSLRKLGRQHEERAALESFLERYPTAVQAGAVVRRLAEIR